MPPKIYFPGRDFDPTPMAKASRALKLTKQLWSEFGRYRDSLGEESDVVLSDDRLTATVRARITHQAPLGEWSLQFGDIVHNYRSALDSFAWALAHLDGATPDSQVARNIYFPLATSESKWTQQRKKELASMPAVILERLEGQQPFRHPPVEQSVGLTLHRLDIMDKHHSLIDLVPIFEPTGGLMIEAAYVEEQVPRPFKYEELAAGQPIVDSAELLRITETAPLKYLRIRKLPLHLTVEDKGQRNDLFYLLDTIDRQVTGTFMAVCAGTTPNIEWYRYVMGQGPRPAGEWFPTGFSRAGWSRSS